VAEGRPGSQVDRVQARPLTAPVADRRVAAIGAAAAVMTQNDWLGAAQTVSRPTTLSTITAATRARLTGSLPRSVTNHRSQL